MTSSIVYNPFTDNLDYKGSSGAPGGAIETINTEGPDGSGNFTIESSDSSVTITPITNGIDLTVPAPGTTCLFSAYTGPSYNDVTGDGTTYTVIFDTALVNLGSAYNTATGVFTAPVDGNYMFVCTLMLDGFLVAHNETTLTFSGSGHENRFFRMNGGAISNNGVINVTGSYILPMTAGQIKYVNAYVSGGTKVIDVKDYYSTFAGYLIP